MKGLCLLVLIFGLCGVVVARDVGVVTYNVRYADRFDMGKRGWSKRGTAVADFLKKEGAEVVGMQEVTHRQLLHFVKRLPGFHYVGVGRDDGKFEGEFCPIFYDAAKWKLGGSGTFWLSKTPEVAGSMGWDAACARVCTWVRLLDAEGKGVYFYNVHLDHKGEQARLESVKLIVERIGKRKVLGDPVVLMGDFNCVLGSEPVKKLLEVKGERGEEVFKKHVVKWKTFHFWSGKLVEGEAIDHFFTTKGVDVKSCEVKANGKASDHHPVLLKMGW